MKSARLILVVVGSFGTCVAPGEVREDFSDGADSWVVSDGARVAVVDRLDRQGDRAIAVESVDSVGVIDRPDSIQTGERDLWVDFQAQPALVAAGSKHPGVGGSPASFYFSEAGEIVVYDGSRAMWVDYPLGPLAVKPGKWVRVSLALNYELQRWTIWIDGKRIASNLGFAAAANSFDGFRIRHRAPDVAMLDDLGIVFERPEGLAGDTDFEDNATKVFMPTSQDVEDEAPKPSLFVPLKR